MPDIDSIVDGLHREIVGYQDRIAVANSQGDEIRAALYAGRIEQAKAVLAGFEPDEPPADEPPKAKRGSKATTADTTPLETPEDGAA